MKHNEGSVRALAIRSLYACRKNGKYTNLEVSASLDRSPLSPTDRALYTTMVYGAVERAITLDYVIARYSARPLSDIDPMTHAALQIGLYQLLYLDRVPDHAAVSETVDACHPRSKAFVNALLRSFIRDGKKFPLPEDRDERISVEYSLPEGLVVFWRERYPGREESLAASTLRRSVTYLRVNTLKADRNACLARLGGEGEACPMDKDVIAFFGDGETLRRGIDEGLWFVEDLSSRLAVRALDPQPGDTVIDCCACPGGKSLSCAVDMGNEGKVFSFDLHENKLSLVRSGAERLGVKIIEAAVCDGRDPFPHLMGKADRLLCDVPCSGLGVIAKKPDIKYKDLSEIARLPGIQYDILSASSSYLRTGGVLVYSTCTLNPNENEHVFENFISTHRDFVPEDFSLGGLHSRDGMLTFFPDEGEYDGFFVARAVRKD